MKYDTCARAALSHSTSLSQIGAMSVKKPRAFRFERYPAPEEVVRRFAGRFHKDVAFPPIDTLQLRRVKGSYKGATGSMMGAVPNVGPELAKMRGESLKTGGTPYAMNPQQDREFIEYWVGTGEEPKPKTWKQTFGFGSSKK